MVHLLQSDVSPKAFGVGTLHTINFHELLIIWSGVLIDIIVEDVSIVPIGALLRLIV